MLVLPQVLTAEELSFVREELVSAEFTDGKRTATGGAADVKNNQQIHRKDLSTSDLDAVLISALMRHSLFEVWAQPLSISAPLINRHSPGMHYGYHVDAPLSPPPNRIRRDLSVTLFLSDPETYEGGELEVECPGGARQLKLKAGDAFIYATHALHQVRQVTTGTRDAAVFWLQSTIQDDFIRQNLFELQAAISTLQSKNTSSQELLLLSKVHQNLTRKFSTL